MNHSNQNRSSLPNPPLWLVMITSAMAGGMGWGIRGQYGHETGAMIAGVLVSLILVFLFCPNNNSIQVVRAAALGTIAMGFGGSMTYGQTVGLTHDAPLIGNWSSLCWGMIGLAIKGGVWIGFFGFFFGLGLGGKRYRPVEILLLCTSMLTVLVIGWLVFNSPHDPENKKLPLLYFSDHWKWEPGVQLKHRPEIWGGLWCALILGVTYAALAKKDIMARNLAFWGIIGGALGFPIGQTLQATNAWNPEFFRQSFIGPFTQKFNWWNIMETTFGTVMGATVGLGLWLNRSRIRISSQPNISSLSRWAVFGLLCLHLCLLTLVDFGRFSWADGIYDLGLMMGLIPLVASVSSLWWPYLQLLPITLLPIAGKTLRMLVYSVDKPINLSVGWLAYFILPMFYAIILSVFFIRRAESSEEHPSFIRITLIFCTWIYFGLNYAFFGFPSLWNSPSALLFLISAVGLSLTGLFFDPAKCNWSYKFWRSP